MSILMVQPSLWSLQRDRCETAPKPLSHNNLGLVSRLPQLTNLPLGLGAGDRGGPQELVCHLRASGSPHAEQRAELIGYDTVYSDCNEPWPRCGGLVYERMEVHVPVAGS